MAVFPIQYFNVRQYMQNVEIWNSERKRENKARKRERKKKRQKTFVPLNQLNLFTVLNPK